MEAFNIHAPNPAQVQQGEYLPARPRVHAGMHMFKERLAAADVPALNVVPLRGNVDVDFFKPATPDDAAITFNTCINQFGFADEVSQQLCSVFLSAICVILPNVEPVAKEVLEQLGARVHDIRLPAQAADNAIEMVACADVAAANVHFAQLVFCLYKNISTDSYANFMLRRTTALRSFAGVDSRNDFTYAINFERAQRIRGMLGSSFRLRKVILQQILAVSRQNTQLGQVCLYVAGILQWTEMTGLVIILETLLQTYSPVIRAPEVSAEVRNLAEAFKLINDSGHPQYFKLLEDPTKHQALERSKFPILLAVARKIRADQFPSMGRFAPVNMAEEAIVNLLYNLHRSHMHRRLAANTQRSVQYLTNFDGIEVEEAAIPEAAPQVDQQ